MMKHFLAKRGMCLFVDRVNRREVWEWSYRGESWMGQSRWGFWLLMSRNRSV